MDLSEADGLQLPDQMQHGDVGHEPDAWKTLDQDRITEFWFFVSFDHAYHGLDLLKRRVVRILLEI
jgi:hypothetical protein